MFDKEKYIRLRKFYGTFKSEQPERMPFLYERNLKEYGEPRWYKWHWIYWWLQRDALPLLYGFYMVREIVRDVLKWLLGWLILAAIPGIPFILGALFGHFIWK